MNKINADDPFYWSDGWSIFKLLDIDVKKLARKLDSTGGLSGVLSVYSSSLGSKVIVEYKWTKKDEVIEPGTITTQAGYMFTVTIDRSLLCTL